MDDLYLDPEQVAKVNSLRNSGYPRELALLSILAEDRIKQKRPGRCVEKGLYRVAREGDTLVVYTETGTWQNNPELFSLLDRFDSDWPTSTRFIAFRKLSVWYAELERRRKAARWLNIPYSWVDRV
jgi:hypothetical protein